MNRVLGEWGSYGKPGGAKAANDAAAMVEMPEVDMFEAAGIAAE